MRFLARLSVLSLDDRLRRPRERDLTRRCCSPDTPGTAAGASGDTPAPAVVAAAAQKVAAPAAVEEGHANPPDATAEAVTPAMSPVALREEEPNRFIKNLASSRIADGRAVMDAPPATGVTSAAAPGATGGWEATASALSWVPRLASRPASSARKRAKEADNRSLDRERSCERFEGACDRAAPPDGQGNAHAHDGSGSGQKTATAHVESGHDATESFHVESGSGQNTATAHGVSDHEKSVTRTMTTSHAHALLTANGKRSESGGDGDAHESYPLET